MRFFFRHAANKYLKESLNLIDLPICMIDKKSKIIWKNKKFTSEFEKEKKITNFETGFQHKKIFDNPAIETHWNNSTWMIKYTKISKNLLITCEHTVINDLNWFDYMPFPIAMLDKDYNIMQANPVFKDLIDEKLDLKKLVKKHHENKEILWPTKFGIIPIISWIKKFEDSHILILENRKDMIKLKAQAQEGLHLQRLGQLTSSIIHDFNNILTAISGLSEVLQETYPNNEIIHEIRNNTDQASNLACELLNFVKQKPNEKKSTNIAKFINNKKMMLEKLLSEKNKCIINVHNSNGFVDLSETQLEQILLNMALNSKDAMPEGGIFKVDLKPVEMSAQQTKLKPGSYFLLEISDTGIGIPRENIQKIFSPFFSTKDKGTGLGLSSCIRLIEQIEGSITLKSTQHGTSFQIYIPTSKNEENIDNKVEETENNTTASKAYKIILVEDDEMVRSLASKALIQAGYSVQAFSNGQEALEKIMLLQEIDCLISDATLPGIDGIELSKQAKKIHPHIPVLIVSGYSADDLKIPKDAYYLAKPFTLKALKETIKKMLG